MAVWGENDETEMCRTYRGIFTIQNNMAVRLANLVEPSNEENEKLESRGLFDFSTLLTILPDDHVSVENDKSWSIKTASNQRFIVVASGSTIVALSFEDSGAKTKFSTSFDDNITDLAIFGKSSFLCVVLKNRTIVVIALDTKQFYFKEEAPSSIDFVHCNCSNGNCNVIFGNYSGETFTSVFEDSVAEPKETNRIANMIDEQVSNYFKRNFTFAICVKKNFNNLTGPICFPSTGSLQSLTSLNSRAGFWWNDMNSPEFISFGETTKWVQARETGRFVLFLADNGVVHVFDPVTICFIDEFDLKQKKTDQILDFIIVENASFGIPTVFASLIKRDESSFIMIFDNSKKSVTFQTECSTQTSMFAFEGSDRILVTIEEHESGDLSKSDVVIRQVSQSRPELKFETLLKQKRFDEAELFAKSHGLDLQLVHLSRANYLMDRCDDNDEDFNMMLKTVDMITNNDAVAEMFFSMIQMSQKFDRISTYLTRAKKRRITDTDTVKQIESCCFILSTYQILRGPFVEDSQEDQNIWEIFVKALHGKDDWVTLYFRFVRTASITDARVVWSRHGSSILAFFIAHIESSSIGKVFELFYDALTTDLSCWSSIIEHITIDILQECLDFSDSLVPLIELLVLNIIELLEIRDVSNWPDNAIRASNCFENMTKVLTDRFITPQDQAFMAINARILCVPSDDETSTPISRMKRIHHILIDIKKLHTLYGCQIKFSVYPSLTNEDICHRILQNALFDPNTINAKIEKFVKPFMQERNLNHDQTIFNYIQRMSGDELSNNKNIVGWEIQCVQLSSSLSDESRKCRSIISIASTAKIPWPQSLNETVEKILKSKVLSRAEIDEMKEVCQQTELIQFLSSYYPHDRSFYNFISQKNKNIILDIITIIRCIVAERDRPSRFIDSIKILELVNSVTQTDWRQALNIEYARSEVVIHMMKTGEMVNSIINYVCQLEETEKEETISSVVNFIKCAADCPIIASRKEILNIAEQMISFFMSKKHDLRSVREQLVLVRELQTEQNGTMLLSDFGDETWIKNKIRFYQNKTDMTVHQKIKRCASIGIEIDQLITALLSNAFTNNNYSEMVEILLASIDSVVYGIPATRELVDVICELLGWILYRLPKFFNTEAEEDQAQNIVEIVDGLSRAVRKIICVFPTEILSDDLEYLLQLEAYFYIFERVVKQALKSQNLGTNSSDSQSALTTQPNSQNGIYGFSRRHGVYDFCDDPALFEGVTAIISIVKVAPSVARPSTSDITEDESHEFRTNWEDLTMFLAMHSQDLLDINIRVYASSLKCFFGEWRQTVLEIGQNVFTVVERMLQQEKFDAWHSATLLNGLSGVEANKRMLELRGSGSIQRNIQAQINFITLAFFMTFRSKSFELVPSIVHSAENKILIKKLAKSGIRTSLGQSLDVVDKIIKQAAALNTPLSPNTLFEYLQVILERFVRSQKTSIFEYMIKYAFLIVQKASDVGNGADTKARSRKIEELLDIAGNALYMVEKGFEESVSNYFSCLVYVVCPYNYEVIQFISQTLNRFSYDDESKDFCKNLQSVMGFLWKYQRTNHVTREESVWYTKREHRLAADWKEYEKVNGSLYPYGMSIKMDYEGACDDMSDSNEPESTCSNTDIVYEKNNVIISDIPSMSSKRIPLHVFLMQKKNDIDEILMEIVKAELSITNVTVWQTSLRSVRWLSKRFSRTHLLSSAIFSHANRYAKVEQALPLSDRNVIFYLLSSNSNRSVVISTIALLFRKIILSDVKIDLLTMGLELAEKWMNTPDIEPPMDDAERNATVEQCDRLRDGIAKFFTELSLKKSGLYMEKTADNIEKVEELCTIIYDELVDWTDSRDVEIKSQIVENIAEANHLDLSKLHETILMNWINDTVVTTTYDHIDLNDSLGGGSFLTNVPEEPAKQQSADDIFQLPLFDRIVDKMTHLCKKIDRKHLLQKLTSIVIQTGDKSANSYNSIVRASCVLLRHFSDQEMKSWNEKVSHVWLCERTNDHLINRLMHLTNVKPTTHQDNNQLIRSLLQCPTRTPAMSSLVACLMIDNSYTETKNIEQIVARLQISKQWSVLKALLDYLKDQGLNTDIKSFALAWFRVYENALSNISLTDEEWSDWQCVSLRKWSLWAMKCNVEGGRQTNIHRILRDISCPVSAYILTLISSFNNVKPDTIDAKNFKRDLELQWTKDIVLNTSARSMSMEQ